MNEKRKTDRWYPKHWFKSDIVSSGIIEEIEVLDVSSSGMRVLSSVAHEVGEALRGKLSIPEAKLPYFIRGSVVRVKKTAEAWEAAICFEKVSTLQERAWTSV